MTTPWKKEYRDRVKQLAPFEVLAGFEQRHKYKQFSVYQKIVSHTQAEIPLRDFIFPLMQYMLANMYKREKITHDHLTHFFMRFVEDSFSFPVMHDEAKEMTDFIVDECLRNQGKKHRYAYFDYQSQEVKEAYFDYIEYDMLPSRIRDDDQIYIKLTFESIELLFKTKEIFGEMQLSIKQLYFKEQMKKGYFHDALQTVTELIYDIDLEKEKIEKLKINVRRNVLEVTKNGSLKEQIQTIIDRLEDQRTIFSEMNSLVKDTMKKYYKGELNEKVRKGIDIINEIDMRLNKTIVLHEELFREKSALRTLTHEAFNQALFGGFGRVFNFEREVLERGIENHANEDTWHTVLKPMYPLKPHRHFNIMKVFEEQHRMTRREEKIDVLDYPTDEEIEMQREQELKEQEREEKREYQYLQILLTPLLTEDRVVFSDLLAAYQNSDTDIDWATLYSFVITLHQRGVLHIEKVDDDAIHYIDSLSRNLSYFYDAHQHRLTFTEFTIHPLRQEVEIDDYYTVLDFELHRKRT